MHQSTKQLITQWLTTVKKHIQMQHPPRCRCSHTRHHLTYGSHVHMRYAAAGMMDSSGSRFLTEGIPRFHTRTVKVQMET